MNVRKVDVSRLAGMAGKRTLELRRSALTRGQFLGSQWVSNKLVVYCSATLVDPARATGETLSPERSSGRTSRGATSASEVVNRLKRTVRFEPPKGRRHGPGLRPART